MHMLDNFVSPIVSHWDSYEELHFTQDGAPPNFALPLLAWFDSHFCGRLGLGVNDDQNDVRGISFSKLNTLEMEPQFHDMVVVMFEGKLLSLCLPRCRIAYKMLGPMFTSYTK